MKKRLLILGAGQYGRVLREIAQATSEYKNIAFLDDRVSEDVIGTLEEYKFFCNEYTDATVAIGNPEVRLHWLSLLESHYNIPIIIHPLAYVSTSAKIGSGSVIEPMVVVHTSVVIGKGCILSSGTVINHNSQLEDGVHCDCGCIIPARSIIKGKRKVAQGEDIINGSECRACMLKRNRLP